MSLYSARERLDSLRTIEAATLGTSLVAMVQLLTVSVLDLWLNAAVACFAVATPLLGFGWAQSSGLYGEESWAPWLGALGMGAGLVGLVFCFLHFHVAFGALFVVSSLVGVWTTRDRSPQPEKSQP